MNTPPISAVLRVLRWVIARTLWLILGLNLEVDIHDVHPQNEEEHRASV